MVVVPHTLPAARSSQLEQAVAQLRSGIAVIVPTLEGERVTYVSQLLCS